MNYVKRELFDALNLAIAKQGRDWVMKTHAQKKYDRKMKWILHSYIPFNDLSLDDMAKYLYEGYELEKTKEELLRDYYNDCLTFENDDSTAFAVIKTLSILNIKINGINDKF